MVNELETKTNQVSRVLTAPKDLAGTSSPSLRQKLGLLCLSLSLGQGQLEETLASDSGLFQNQTGVTNPESQEPTAQSLSP